MLQDTFFNTKSTIHCRGKIINLSTPVVMGIINLAPDSFYDGGRYRNKFDILKRAESLLTSGSTILDLGAASSRPGSLLADAQTEKRKLLPALEVILQEFPTAIVSIDTYNASTAKAAIEHGAHIINDISAGNIDPAMFKTVANLQVPYIMMHMKGTPEHMQDNPVYEDPVREIAFYFSKKIAQLRQLGVHDIIIDPGFGFGKNLEDNYRILANLDYFKIFELPLLAGVSRKSMINRVLGVQPADALNGTTVIHTLALEKGASILRVHDAREASEAISLIQMYKSVNS